MSDRPALLLIPGLLCDARVWRDVAARLEDVARPVIVENLSDHDSIPAMARAALAAVEEPFALAGFSLGGRIALEMLRAAPERVTHLALLDSGYGPVLESEAESRGALVRVARERGMAAMVRLWLPPMLKDANRTGKLADDLAAMAVEQGAAAFARQQQALLTRPDATPILGAISAPTLVLVGRDDTWSPLEQNAAMAALIPGARMVVIEGAGHFAPAEQPEAVADAMREWLAR